MRRVVLGTGVRGGLSEKNLGEERSEPLRYLEKSIPEQH